MSDQFDATVQALAVDAEVTRAVQAALIGEGVPLSWIVDVPVGSDGFAPAQEAALDGRLDPAELGMHACRLAASTARCMGISQFLEPG